MQPRADNPLRTRRGGIRLALPGDGEMSGTHRLARRFGSNVMWNAVGTISLQGGTFATNLAVANLLGAERYGQFAFMITTAQTVATVLQLSNGVAAGKYVAEYRRDDPGRALAILRLLGRISRGAGALGALLLFVFAATLADATATFAGQSPLLMIAAPIVLFSVLTGLQTGALAALEGYARSARLLLPLALIQIATTSAAAAFSGLPAALLVMMLNFALRAWVCGRLLDREAAALSPAPAALPRPLLRQIVLGFMLPSALAGVANLPALWLATAALARLPDGYAELGRFNAALGWRGVLMIVPWIVNTVGLSLLNAHLGRDDARDYRRILALNLGLCGTAAGVGAIVVLAAAPWLLRAYGPGFDQAQTALRVLMLSLMAEALSWPLYQALASRRRVWIAVTTTQLPRDLSIATLGMWWATTHGAIGVAWAHACGWMVALVGCAALLAFGPRGSSA